MSGKRMLLAAFCLVAMCGVQAAERLWTGGGDAVRWSDPANWGGTAPSAGDSVRFENTFHKSGAWERRR